jgi:hypothetical protein
MLNVHRRSDLTREATPVTQPLTARPGARLGELGDVFNVSLTQEIASIAD